MSGKQENLALANLPNRNTVTSYHNENDYVYPNEAFSEYTELHRVEGNEHIYHGLKNSGVSPPPEYTDTLPTKARLTPSSPPPDYEDIHATVKTSTTPNKFGILKIIGAVCLGLAIILLLVGIIIVLVKSGGDGNSSTTTKMTSHGTSPGITNTTTASIPTTGTASTTTTTIQTTTPGTDPPDAWSSWGAWSDCSVTCGEGVRTRDRDCPTGYECDGTDTQAKPCDAGKCSGPDYGQWTSWGQWSDCTVSCDSGVQDRTRTCEQEADQEPCPGSSSQTRPCNDFDCPSCSDTCPDGGTMDPTTCNRCSCPSQTYTAKVQDESNLAVAAVRVTDDRWPNVLLATSDNSGNFDITEACNGIKLSLTRGDYVDATSVIDPSNTVITMEKIELLTISQHPQSKVRIGGESVTLCCVTNGNPPPDYFEWFKDGAIIDPSTYNHENQLVISSVTADDTGYYRCRANNEYSAIYSEEAYLLVKDTPADFCTPTPSPKVISLPRGCELNGKREVDVGECSPKACRYESNVDSGDCIEDQNLYCCGPIEFDTTIVQCSDGLNLPLSFVKTCGCIVCPYTQVKLVGIVLSADGNSAWPYSEIVINGTTVTHANSQGEFHVMLSILDSPKVAVTVKDTYFMHGDTTKMVNLKNAKRGIIIKVFKIQPRNPPVTIDSTKENSITIGKNDKPLGVVVIPPNSFYTEDGQLFTGDVMVSTSVIDPRNISDMLIAPGELSFRNQEGLSQPLLTRGMFSMFFANDKYETLQLGNKVQVGIDQSLIPSYLLNDQPINFLWGLNPKTGIWDSKGTVQNGSHYLKTWKEKKLLKGVNFDTIVVGDIEITGDYINFDSNFDQDYWCYTKVRVFESNEFISQVANSVKVSIVVLDPDIDEEFVGGITDSDYWGASSDTNPDINGYCVFHICDNFRGSTRRNFDGYIIVEDESLGAEVSRLHPAEFNIGMTDSAKEITGYVPVVDSDHPGTYTKYSLRDIAAANENGPFYNYDDNSRSYTQACSNADMDENHFRFFKEKLPACNEPFDTRRYVTFPPAQDLNYLAWYPRSAEPEPVFEVCFVKVYVIQGIGEAFRAESHMGTFENPPGGQTLYGVRDKCLSSDEDAVCIEVKHAGVVTDGINRGTDETLVTIRQQSEEGTCTLEEIRDNMVSVYGEDIVDQNDPNKLQFYLQTQNYGEVFGIYCVSADTEEEALTLAETTCSKGEDSNESMIVPATINTNNWLVKFNCNNS